MKKNVNSFLNRETIILWKKVIILLKVIMEKYDDGNLFDLKKLNLIMKENQINPLILKKLKQMKKEKKYIYNGIK